MRVAVVGGGISGLTAAYRLRTLLGIGADITVFESSGVPGGKLDTRPVGRVFFDLGAEAFLARRPEVPALAEELGLSGEIVAPSGARATVRAGGVTMPLPGGTLMGIPGDPATVADVLSPAGAAAVAAERSMPPLVLPPHDVSLGGLLRERFGDELLDRLVDPLLGGVYAGGADGLGLRAVLPQLAAALDAGPTSLTEAVAGLLPPAKDAPVFGTFRGGMRSVVDRLLERSGARLRVGTVVRELGRDGAGWAVAGERFDAVLLAVPAPAARELLADVSAPASEAFAEIELASMAVVALALPEGTALPEASGVLIGAGERRADGTPLAAKAFTFSCRKWRHVADAGVLVRGSVGRFGDTAQLRATDEQLIRQVRTDLADLAGVTAAPLAAAVRRWGGGLPQYGIGHADRVEAIERAVAEVPGLEIAGAALHGVGIPACVATADAAARRLADQLPGGSAGVGG